MLCRLFFLIASPVTGNYIVALIEDCRCTIFDKLLDTVFAVSNTLYLIVMSISSYVFVSKWIFCVFKNIVSIWIHNISTVMPLSSYVFVTIWIFCVYMRSSKMARDWRGLCPAVDCSRLMTIMTMMNIVSISIHNISTVMSLSSYVFVSI
jgi:hypothetical protein